MTTAHKVTTALAIALFIGVIFVGYGWLKSHDAALTLQTQQQEDAATVAQIAASEQDNKAALVATLASYTQLAAQTKTPAQIVQALPQVITLPAPIVQVTAAQAAAANTAAPANAPALTVGDLIIPAADSKAFFDAQVSCKACAAQLSSSQVTIGNLTSENAVKDTEIKQQQVVINGGTKTQHVKSAVKWGVIGAAVGAVAVEVLINKK